MKLFHRAWSLSVTSPTGQVWCVQPSAQPGDATLRLSFSIQKHLEPNPNPAQIMVTNLAESTRKRFSQARGHRIALSVGYRDGMTTIFVGSIYLATSEKSGTEWVTRFEALDGGTTYQRARIKTTIAQDTTLLDVLKTIADRAKTQDNIQVALRSLRDVPDVQIPGGAVLSGDMKELLDQYTRGHGLVWSLQDDQLQIHAATGDTGEGQVVLSPTSGLIGSPKQKVDHAGIFLRTGVTFSCLMNGQIRPGRRVELRDCAVPGVFTAARVTFSGDSSGQNWYTEVEAF